MSIRDQILIQIILTFSSFTKHDPLSGINRTKKLKQFARLEVLVYRISESSFLFNLTTAQFIFEVICITFEETKNAGFEMVCVIYSNQVYILFSRLFISTSLILYLPRSFVSLPKSATPSPIH